MSGFREIETTIRWNGSTEKLEIERKL